MGMGMLRIIAVEAVKIELAVVILGG